MYLIAGVVIVVVIAGVILAYSGNLPSYGPQQTATETQPSPAARQASLTVSSQSVVGDEVVVDSLYLDKPGYAVIHQETDGKPGAVIGNSELISGEKNNFKVTIDANKAGTKVFAMLHYDDDNDGVYGFPDEDNPVKLEGNVVVKPIEIQKAAQTAGGATQVQATVEQPAVEEFGLEADDSGYYQDGIAVTALSPKKGNTVKIIFTVRKTGVSFGGLDFRSPDYGIDTTKTEPGGSKTVQFVAEKSGKITSYWPASNNPKATLQISPA